MLKRTATLAGTMTVGGACVCVFVKDVERDIVKLSDCTAAKHVWFAVPHSMQPSPIPRSHSVYIASFDTGSNLYWDWVWVWDRGYLC